MRKFSDYVEAMDQRGNLEVDRDDFNGPTTSTATSTRRSATASVRQSRSQTPASRRSKA